jgi:FixJ family two-component response regulator
MPTSPARVYIVDDEPAIRTALARLMRSAAMEPFEFASVEDFIQAGPEPENSCALVDIRMPGTSGLGLPRLLEERGLHIPIIFITAHDTKETRALAKQAGAAAYFRKPVDDQALLDAIEWALSHPHPTGETERS